MRNHKSENPLHRRLDFLDFYNFYVTTISTE